METAHWASVGKNIMQTCSVSVGPSCRNSLICGNVKNSSNESYKSECSPKTKHFLSGSGVTLVVQHGEALSSL